MSNDKAKPLEKIHDVTVGETIHNGDGLSPTTPSKIAKDPLQSSRSVSETQATVELSSNAESKDALDFLLPPTQPDEIGRLSSYRILRKLGQGGMGMVFEAEDVSLHRRVAMKVIRPDLARDVKNRARFLREAQSAAMLDHDFICPIYQVGEENSVLFITMPLLKGEALDVILRRNTHPNIHWTIKIGIQIAKGLDIAHRSGLIHRDIKPANIWIEKRPDESERVKILDFGLAWSEENSGELTRSGTILGTPAYMAPEQARGSNVDHRSDLFSLGVILYEMATGRRPFQGSDAFSILTSLAVDEPTEPARINPTIEPRLSQLIMELLSKSPDERPASATEVTRRLEESSLADATTSNLSTSTEKETQFKTSHLPTTTTPTIPSPSSASSRSFGSHVVLGIVALAIFGFGWFGYTLIFRNQDGTLVIEVEEDADVRMREGHIEIHDEQGKLLYSLRPTDKKDSTLPAGKYMVNVEGADGVVLETERFEMKRGEVVKLRVSAAPPEPQSDNKVAVQGLTSPLLATDLFAGKLVSQDFFDNPVLCALPKSDGPNGRSAQKDGTYVIERDNCKAGDAAVVIFGRPGKRAAVNFRFQIEEGQLFFNFASINDGKTAHWISMVCYPKGRWNISKRRKDLVGGSWIPAEPILIAENQQPNSKLESGNWVFLSCRWSESEFEVWLNGEKIAGSSDPAIFDEYGNGNCQPMQLGVVALRQGTQRIRLNYYSFWEQQDVSEGLKHSDALSDQIKQ